MDPHRTTQEALAQRFEHRVGFFARQVARRYRLGTHWHDDLVSAGYWGLATALDRRRHDASDGELSAYVSTRIHGAVLDEARSCLSRATSLTLASDLRRPGEEEGSDEDWLQCTQSESGPTPEDSTQARSLRGEVERALGGVEAAPRRWLRAYMGGATLSELAEREGVPESTLRMRFQKATRLLRAREPHMRTLLREGGAER